MKDDQVSYAVIGEAMRVHRELGPGLDEVFYHELLSERLRHAGIEHLFKPREALIHRGQTADVFEPGLVLPGRLIPELKVLWGGFEPEHCLQLQTYLKFWKIPVGLLFDFGKESLVHKRFAFTDSPLPPVDGDTLASPAPAFVTNRELAHQIGRSLGRIWTSHGAGYRDTTYRGLLVADLWAENLKCVPRPTAPVRCGNVGLGEARLRCIAVENECAIRVLALRDEIRAADRAVLQSCLRHLGYRWGLVVHFGRWAIELRWVSAPALRL